MELNNEIRAKVFGLYLGCDVYDLYNADAGKLIGLNTIEERAIVKHNTTWAIGYGEVKLLLTNLENITDADAIACYDLQYPDLDKNDDDKIALIKNWIHRKVISVQQGDYLRSKFYAVDYCGLNLFQSGIAIERTPTVQPRDKEQEPPQVNISYIDKCPNNVFEIHGKVPGMLPVYPFGSGDPAQANQTDDPATLYGDGAGHALPPIESHPIDEEQTKQP